MADIGALLAQRSLAKAPRIGDWLAFDPAGEVIVRTGKAELGQGILTALALIAAEELGVDARRVRVPAVSTRGSPDEDYTAGSFSVSVSGGAVRLACAAARSLLLQAAAERLAVSPDALTVADGVVAGGGGYWDGLPPDAMARRIDSVTVIGRAGAGRGALGRLDLPDKFAGRPRFVQDLELPGLLFGRVVRSHRPGSRLEAFDDARAAAIPGVVRIVRDGDFIGVLAGREEAAARAAQRLHEDCRWTPPPTAPPTDASWLVQHALEPDAVVADEPSGRSAVHMLEASYSKPYIAHAAIGPSCGVARFDPEGGLEVWSHTQGVFPLRRELALILGLAEHRIVVNHMEGAGCYGHNGAEDAALDAVLMARAVPGRPVKVQWTRADEFAHEPYGPVMLMRLGAGLDAEGRVVSWRHDLWSNGHTGRPGRSKQPSLLAAAEMAGGQARAPAMDPPIEGGGGSHRNAVPLYDFPARQVTRHLVAYEPVRVSSLRSLGAFANVFAIESFVDELAELSGQDPVAFRLRHLSDERARAVITAVADRADWGAPREGRSLGLGFARYKNTGAWCAAIAETDEAHPLGLGRLVLAVDAGRIVSPDGVLNQVEGGAAQAASWTLKEAVTLKDGQPPLTWPDYPILRFSEVPQVEAVLLDRPQQPSLGVGECVHGPVAAAIANAFARAYGVRVRNLPITRERILAAST